MIRRLAAGDLQQVRAIQAGGIAYEAYYPRHAAWLNKALYEVEKGARRAYGYFGTLASNRESSTKVRLLGSVMIRVSSGDVVEIKNLVTRSRVDHEHPDVASDTIGRSLIRKVVTASRRKGFSVLETELPAVADEQIRWFLSEGFRIQSSRESSVSRVPFYLLRMETSPCYRGDPFDSCSMARWLLDKRLGWRVLDEEAVLVKGKAVCVRIIFSLGEHFSHSKPLPSKNVSEAELKPLHVKEVPPSLFQVTGDCLVDLDRASTSELMDIFISDAKMRRARDADAKLTDLHFFTSAREYKFGDHVFDIYGVRVVTGKRLLNEIGYWSLDSSLRLKYEDVAGIIIQIGHSFKKRFVELCDQGKAFEFIITNGLGKVLESRQHELKTSLTAVFCTSEFVSDEDEQAGLKILGIASIHQVVARPASTAAISPLHNGLAEAGYIMDHFTANFNSQELVWRLTLDPAEVVTNQPLLMKCVSSSIKPFVQQAAAGELLTCYADLESVLKIQAASSRAPPLTVRDEKDEKPLWKKVCDQLADVLGHLSTSTWLKKVAGNAGSDQIKEVARFFAHPVDNQQDRSAKKRRGSGARGLFGSISEEEIVETLKTVGSHAGGWATAVRDKMTVGDINESGRKTCFFAAQLLEQSFDLLETELPKGMGGLQVARQWLNSIRMHSPRFEIALSYRRVSKHMRLVEKVANELAIALSKDKVLFDDYHAAELAGFRSNELLQAMFFNESKTIVVFLTQEYITTSKWTYGVEWKQIRRLRQIDEFYRRVMLVQLEDVDASKLGLDFRDTDIAFSGKRSPRDIAEAILNRHRAENGTVG